MPLSKYSRKLQDQKAIRIIELHTRGYSFAKIAKELNSSTGAVFHIWKSYTSGEIKPQTDELKIMLDNLE